MVKSDVAAAIIIEKIVRATYPSREPGAIQPLQWSILRFLARVPPEQCTANMVAKFLGITAAPTSRTIQTLVKRGFIKQMKSEHDARSFLLVLQPPAFQALKDDPIMRLAECVAKLPESEKGVFKKSLECIIVNVG